MRFHLDQLIADRVADGLSPEEARYAAERKFGNVGLIQEQSRDARGGRWFENARKDFRHGLRILARAPGFTAAAVASLALGIGANTAMFSVIDTVLLKPLPYAEPERLVALWTENRALNLTQQPSTEANIADWRAASRTLSGIAAYDPTSMIVSAGEPRRTSGVRTSANLASVLGVAPQLGRMFTAEEAQRRDPVAVISHEAWQQHHAGAADILGRRIEVDGRPVEIIGVLPAGFRLLNESSELWVPWVDPSPARGAGAWRVVARLAPGTSRAEAQAELSLLAGTLAREYPAFNAGLDVRLTSLGDAVVGRDLRTALLLLLAAVGAVLLIACSNVGNLLLARGLVRQREFALRLSLGATRGRLVAQLLAETFALCLPSIILGAGLAWLAVEGVRRFVPGNVPRMADVTLDPGMLALAALLSLISAALFGLLPMLAAAGRDPHARLRDGGRGSTEAPGGRRLRSALVVGEFALAVVLFAGAGVLVRSFTQLLAVDPGFQVRQVLLAPLRLSAHRPAADAIPFSAAVIERVSALPGVTGAAISEEVLLGERSERLVSAEGAGSDPMTVMRLPLSTDAVTPDYFSTLGVALRAGRLFSTQDTADSMPVVIVNETLARLLWPQGDAVGRRIRAGGSQSTAPWVTVIGVVSDQRRQTLDRVPIPQAFWPLTQQPSRAMNLVVRTAVEPASLAAAVRQAIRSVDATVPIDTLTTLQQQVDRTVAPRRFHTGLLMAFAAIAFVLAGVGIFGLMHYAVARRTHEIGVRTALGANPRQILRQVMGEGLMLAGLGVLLGLAGAMGLLRVFSGLLYQVSPLDPWSLGGAAIALLVMAMLACLLPALRASRIDPMVALRCE